MKSFVRERQRGPWDALLIVVVIGNMMLAAETFGEIAYLPLYAFLAIEFVRGRLWRRRSSKELPDGARSKGSH